MKKLAICLILGSILSTEGFGAANLNNSKESFSPEKNLIFSVDFQKQHQLQNGSLSKYQENPHAVFLARFLKNYLLAENFIQNKKIAVFFKDMFQLKKTETLTVAQNIIEIDITKIDDFISHLRGVDEKFWHDHEIAKERAIALTLEKLGDSLTSATVFMPSIKMEAIESYLADECDFSYKDRDEIISGFKDKLYAAKLNRLIDGKINCLFGCNEIADISEVIISASDEAISKTKKSRFDLMKSLIKALGKNIRVGSNGRCLDLPENEAVKSLNDAIEKMQEISELKPMLNKEVYEAREEVRMELENKKRTYYYSIVREDGRLLIAKGQVYGPLYDDSMDDQKDPTASQ